MNSVFSINALQMVCMCSTEHGKLCFELLEIFSAAQNYLSAPDGGGETISPKSNGSVVKIKVLFAQTFAFWQW